ncbi:exopolyphosphatase [Fulvitalea axinellae]|uniref:Exopolyphosphatase n=1 Tax=Fulvitalea axinellae TaxID=1182444 RepID=A0AAU9CHA7_9BACT|nr:exopolyphosphatase [Fulvitalea axinellae]
MRNIEALKQMLGTAKNIVIIPHYKPDADALGSCLGLAGMLGKKGHTVKVISPTDYPDFLFWMKGHDQVQVYKEEFREEIRESITKADIVFCLDFSALNRIGALGEFVAEAEGVKIVVDHHLDPEEFADHMIWDTKAAATAELLYQLAAELGDIDLIDPDIADCLYAGIMTDTGSFKHSNTTKNTLLVAAELIGLGADNAKVGSLIYDNNSLDRLKLTGFALSQKLVVHREHRTAFFTLSSNELRRFNAKTGDTEGLVNYALSIKDIVFSALITEREDGVKLSLRSKGKFPVNVFAKNHFNGGGHRNASGGRIDMPLAEAVKYFENLLPKYAEELKNA